MKLSENWLREWTDPGLDTAALAERLTLAGHEVESLTALGAGLDEVVVAEIGVVEPHPNADRLNVCQVSIANGEPLQIVCGAPNARAGLRAPLALPGARLPNGLSIRRSKLRGVESQGMLCSPAELGFGDDHDGLMELAADAPLGERIGRYLGLPDTAIDVNLTPNRGDCFSVIGIAREIAAATGAALTPPSLRPVAAAIDDTFGVTLSRPADCPRFVCRVIRNIDTAARSPAWMVERLRRSGVRSIHPVVDVTNYVLLELGQPLHGYDLGLVQGGIDVRRGRPDEKLVLLDGREVELDDDVLVIADDSGAIGLAGIMGGESTAVSGATVDVLLEGAFFSPTVVAGRARRFGLHTDASLRFERGVDPQGQVRAIERATELLIAIAGGTPGPIVEEVVEVQLPVRDAVSLSRARLARIVGIEIPDDTVREILERLGMSVAVGPDGFTAEPPSHRFDIEIAEDLVEEIVRIYGYERVPEITATSAEPLPSLPEAERPESLLRDLMIASGYHEAVTYSFVNPELQTRMLGDGAELSLANPLSVELSVMRRSLLPGLAGVVELNLARQQTRLRFFEIGRCFIERDGAFVEVDRLAAIACGPVLPEQWSSDDRPVDFFDIKSDLARLAGPVADALEFVPASHPALHPGQSAEIRLGGRAVGHIGMLHPRLCAELDFDATAVFEVDIDAIRAANVPEFRPLSRFPAVRRDIALVVDESVPSDALVAAVRQAIPALLRDVFVFDIYRGKGIEAGLKSVALGLILQETSRTLTDEETDRAIRNATATLERNLGAKLRDR